MNVFDKLRNCEDCARRRAEWLATARKMAETVIGKTPKPVTPERVIDPDVERRARSRFLNENPGATESDWDAATDVLRHNYRVAVQTE